MGKLTVYRLGDAKASSNFSDLLSTTAKLRAVSLKAKIDGKLFIAEGDERTPEWETYLGELTATKLRVRKSASTGAVLFLRLNGAAGPIYACTWGTGHLLLKRHLLTPDLGVRVALNLITADNAGKPWDASRIRAVQSKSLVQSRLAFEAQAPRLVGLDSFPVDARHDLLKGITAIPVDTSSWGKLISGSTSIHIGRPKSASKLVERCRAIEAAYAATTYQAQYGWIDNVRAIDDVAIRDSILTAAVEALKGGTIDGLDLCPPEIIDWSRVVEFRYRLSAKDNNSNRYDAPTLADYVQLLKEKNKLAKLSLATMRSAHELVAIGDNDEELGVWPVLSCLFGAVSAQGVDYVIEGSNAYLVSTDYMKELNADVDSIAVSPLPFPTRKPREREDAYNERVAKGFNGLLLDKKLVNRPGATSIEVCDIALQAGTLIHVKRGKGASQISHVVAQAAVSAELLRADVAFRTKVQVLLNDPKKVNYPSAASANQYQWIWTTPFSTQTCTVVIGVIDTWAGSASLSGELPFFSKVNVRNRINEIRRSGFLVDFARISTK